MAKGNKKARRADAPKETRPTTRRELLLEHVDNIIQGKAVLPTMGNEGDEFQKDANAWPSGRWPSR